jgi:hypothetical protein
VYAALYHNGIDHFRRSGGRGDVDGYERFQGACTYAKHDWLTWSRVRGRRNHRCKSKVKICEAPLVSEGETVKVFGVRWRCLWKRRIRR